MNVTSALPSYAVTAIVYSAFTSSGFILSVLVGWLLVRVFSSSSLSSTRGGNDVRDIGSYGKFMVVMEAIDAVPEALVIAASTADGTMTFSLAASIFFLNVVNTLSTALDFLAVTSEPVFPRLMLVLVSFSVGSMAFSISSIMFEGFVFRVVTVACRACYAGAFYGGIVAGVLLVWTLTLVESRLRRRFGVRDVPARPFNSAQLTERVRAQIQREKAVAARLQRDAKHDANAAKELVFYAERIKKMQNMLDTSQQAIELCESTTLYVADDASAAIQEALAQQWNETFYRPSPGRESGAGGLTSGSEEEEEEHDRLAMDDGHEERSDSMASLVAREKQKRCCPRWGPLATRGTKLLLIMVAIFAWTVALTFAFTPLFALLDSHSSSQYLETFADGMSGGAFLALIGSTMIPRMQQDAYRTMWTAVTTKSVGMFGFVTGVVATFSIDLIRATVMI